MGIESVTAILVKSHFSSRSLQSWGEDGVRGCDVNIFDSMITKDFARAGNGAGRGDHVIDDKHIFAFHFADDVFAFHGGAAATALFDETELAIEPLGINLGAFDVADIRGDKHFVGELETFKPGGDDRARV